MGSQIVCLVSEPMYDRNALRGVAESGDVHIEKVFTSTRIKSSR